MAYKFGGDKVLRISENGKGFVVPKTDRLESLEKKLNLVAAAEGKSKSEVLCDALEAYLPDKWKAIVAEYQK